MPCDSLARFEHITIATYAATVKSAHARPHAEAPEATAPPFTSTTPVSTTASPAMCAALGFSRNATGAIAMTSTGPKQ